MEGLTFAAALDLNMRYYVIRMDPDAQKVCTISISGGKYSYLCLPMGIAGSPNIFQEKITTLMEKLEYVHTYINNLLVFTNSMFNDHLQKVDLVTSTLR